MRISDRLEWKDQNGKPIRKVAEGDADQCLGIMLTHDQAEWLSELVRESRNEIHTLPNSVARQNEILYAKNIEEQIAHETYELGAREDGEG